MRLPSKQHANRKIIGGVYRGVVEYNIDPLKLGRVKVRVPNLHSTEKSIKTEDLPWASSRSHYGGGHDIGSFYVPIVGSTVWVEFEMDDPEHPIYFGGWWKNPDELREMNTITSEETGKVLPERPISMGRWDQPFGPEVPHEIMSTPYEPTTSVLHKTPKGHTVLFEDRDGFEIVRIIDRLGQEFRMVCPVVDTLNEHNDSQRKNRSAVDSDAYPNSHFAGGQASIEMHGANGQGIKIITRSDGDSVEITSKDSSAKVSEGASERRIKMNISSGAAVFEVGGLNGAVASKLLIDLNTGTIELETEEEIKLSAKTCTLQCDDVQISGEVTIDRGLTVRGDLVIAGDLVGGS